MAFHLKLVLVQNRADFFKEIVDVAKLPIDAGEPDVGHIVDLNQLLHDHLADLLAVDLGASENINTLNNFDYRFFNRVGGDGAFPACSLDSLANLFRAKQLARVILFDNLNLKLANSFVSRKAFFAAGTHPPTANRQTVFA